ncbi:hypothetical protein ACB092_05G220900 [Castanea dentata]
MKKLYRRCTVHPSPPIISDHLSFLPATILTLTVALSPEDREVLAYLLSSSCSNYSSVTVNFNGSPQQQQQQRNRVVAKRGSLSSDHPPQFSCNCFRCYTSYWVRWDESPNRQLIHEIIDAFETELAQSKSGKGNRKERRNSKRGCNSGSSELKRSESRSGKNELSESDSVGAHHEGGNNNKNNNGGEGFVGGGGDGEEGLDKGSVRRLVSFIGERIWGVWNQ